MTLRLRLPGTNTIINPQQKVTRKNCIIAIRQPPNQLILHLRPSILTLKMRRQRIGE
jgi:hypothetical protein